MGSIVDKINLRKETISINDLLFDIVEPTIFRIDEIQIVLEAVDAGPIGNMLINIIPGFLSGNIQDASGLLSNVVKRISEMGAEEFAAALKKCVIGSASVLRALTLFAVDNEINQARYKDDLGDSTLRTLLSKIITIPNAIEICKMQLRVAGLKGFAATMDSTPKEDAAEKK